MSSAPPLDDEARVELLCYLVVAQLVARARSGDWLRTHSQLLQCGWHLVVDFFEPQPVCLRAERAD